MKKVHFAFLIFAALLIFIWEQSSREPSVRILISSPSNVVDYMMANPAPLLKATVVTFQEAASGFLIAITLSLLIVTICMWLPSVLNFVLPIMISSQVIPLIVLAPFFTIALGYGLASKTAMAAVLCFFPIFMGFIQGFRVIPDNVHDYLKVYEADPIYRVFRVYLPMSLPGGMAGLKVGATLSVIGAIVAEFSGAQIGLGKNLFISTTRLDPELMVSSIILSSLLGAVLFGSVHLAERWLGGWYLNDSSEV